MKPLQRWLLWTSSALTGSSGVVYWWMDHMLGPPSEWAIINHPLQPWVLKAHILAAPVLVFAVGLIALDHVWKHFRNSVRRGRRSGVSTMWVVAPMILTGYLIQTVTNAFWLELLGWAHLAVGGLYMVAVALHQLAVRRWQGQPSLTQTAPREADRSAPRGVATGAGGALRR